MGHIVGVNFGVYGFSPSGDYARKPIDIMPETRCMAIPKPTACACRISDGEPHHSTQGDRSLSEIIDNIARCVIASLFYFELDSIPGRNDGKHVGSGRILCSLRCHEPAFQELLGQLSSISAQFCLNERPVAAVNDPSCFDKDGNFRRRIELNTTDRFTISLKQGSSEPCNISGSPFSVEKLIQAQGLDASFGRPDHRKRKAGDDLENPNKRQKCI